MTAFSNVTVDAKANVYFEGRVISHTVHFADGTRKTLGLIGTAAPERMEIIAGACQVTLDGTTEVSVIEEGSTFDVAGNSGFTIQVNDGICEYICSFLPA